ncbi:MAG: tRNA (adenosine(37)-N6)-threonylcarbamoyltransferase complex transferase subunit TsaD [Puniceicoccales bacterium]|jgi:N6-L-threonylcarbamoyladenine synthase|nr:tRNA (adenosine(37)-N6)-threonylcarbamoyltransferase complex transferase subunit TsaD [Puniceicoccales bacterium]
MILAIESSCDESALALFDPARGIIGEWVHTQAALHGEYGGVVPDIASREHLRHLPGLLRLLPAGFSPETLRQIAVTRGPGLVGSLALGIAFAKALALAWRKPLVGINHLRGHLFSPFIALHAGAPEHFRENLARQLPHLGLVVSGGNTLLVEIARDGHTRIHAQTVDDAAGEAFDKGAKLLGLPYPGGALIEQHARTGDATAHNFPRGIPEKNDPRFSFSGLKTSLRYKLEKLDDTALATAMPGICASYQAAIVGQLLAKTHARLAHNTYASLGLSGGVANNQALRDAFATLAKRHHLPLHIACPRHSGDNAAMIAFAAHADTPPPPRATTDWTLGFEPSLTIEQP